MSGGWLAPLHVHRAWSALFRGQPPFYGNAVVFSVSTAVLVVSYSCTIDVLCLMLGAITAETGLSRSLLSALLLVGTVSAGACQPFTGRLIDRAGARSVGSVAMLVHASGLFVLSRARGAPALATGFTLVRVGGIAGTLLSQDALMSRWFVRRLGAIVAAQRVLVAVLAVSLLPLLIGRAVPRVGWRTTYAGLALPLLLVSPVAALTLLPTPESCGLRPDGAPPPESAEAVQAPPAKPAAASEPDSEWAALLAPTYVEAPPLGAATEDGPQQWLLRDALKTSAFWWLLLLNFFTCLTTGGVTAHASLIAADAGIALSQMTQLVLVPTALAGVAVNISFGLLLNRGAPLRLLFLCSLALLAAATATAAVMLSQASSPGRRNAAAACWGLLYGGGTSSFYFLYKVCYPLTFGRSSGGSIMGLANSSMFCAIGLGPVLYGVARDHQGSYAPALRVSCAACAVAAGAAWAFVGKPPERRRPQGAGVGGSE